MLVNNKRLLVSRLFFPWFGPKLFKSSKAITIIAVLLALRIVFQFISIPIPGLVLSIGFAWLPVMILGWYFGPIYGFILGAICDTLGFLVSGGGVWFWMYAIQEPIVGMVAGLFSGLCQIRIALKKTRVGLDMFLHQIILIAFSVASITMLFVWLNDVHSQGGTVEIAYKISAIIILSIFVVIVELFSWKRFFDERHNYDKLITFIYASIVVIITMLLFSLLLGPIITVQYLVYLNGHTPDAWINYGASYYLMPRLIIDSIKLPIECALLTLLIFCCNPMMQSIRNHLSNSWER